MTVLSPNVRDLLTERLHALLDDCEQVLDNADHGQAFHDLDDFLLIAGKQFLNEIFEQKLQERIEKTEPTPEGKQCPHCKKKRNTKTKKRKR
jgi:dihydrofolate reductase